LRGRREALIRRSEGQRFDLEDHMQQIEAALDGVDRGLSLVQRVATPTVLFAGSVLATLLLGRRRSRSALVAGLGLISQLVRRSR
jgi:hypothetical protein